MSWLGRLIRTIGRKVICTCTNPERCPMLSKRASGGPISAERAFRFHEDGGPPPLVVPPRRPGGPVLGARPYLYDPAVDGPIEYPKPEETAP